MTWTKGRQLATVGSTTAYAYNDQGIRIKNTISTTETKYHLVGDRVTAETTGTQTQYYTYSATGELVGIRWDGDSYYYIKNAQGDIIQIVDDSGSVVVAYTYDTWGKLVSITGSAATTLGVANPYRYRGYRYDNETGFYYLNSRYYDPETGRFINCLCWVMRRLNTGFDQRNG
jgi:RHS repeat-associated protein